jgi:hypothetical protein
MDASQNPARGSTPNPAAASGPRGGSIEPETRSPRKARQDLSTAQSAPATREPAPERFELRDPFAETIYHSKRFDEMAAKAEQLGSNRFTAIDAQGKRTLVRQVDGAWTRGPLRSVDGPQAQPPAPSTRTPEPESQPATTSRSTVRNPAPTEPRHADTAKPDPAEARRIAQAERAARVAQLETALSERYVVKRAAAVADISVGTTEYRFRGDTARVAFTETSFKLATDTNSPSVARSMVDVAETRQWKTLRVTGNEDFKRMVWLEASVRQIRTVGYEPNKADQDQLRREREARQVNRIEPWPDTATKAAPDPDKASVRGSGGRKAVLAAIEAVLVAKKVPDTQRAAVMAAATEKLAHRTRETTTAKVRVYDLAAPSQRPPMAPQPEMARSRDRAGPAPAR